MENIKLSTTELNDSYTNYGLVKGIQITSTNIFTDISGFFAGLVGSKNDNTITKHYLEAYDAAISKMKQHAYILNKNITHIIGVKIDVSELSKGGNSQGYIVIAAYGTAISIGSNKNVITNQPTNKKIINNPAVPKIVGGISKKRHTRRKIK